MRPILLSCVYIALLALLYVFVAPILAMKLLSGTAHVGWAVEWIVKYLALLLAPLAGLFVGYEAARWTGRGLVAGMAVGVTSMAVGWGVFYASYLQGDPPLAVPDYVPLTYAAATVLTCALGGYWCARRAQKRALR